jgi:hypothetical protein
MNVQKTLRDSLEHLFQGYISSGGTGVFSIDEVATQGGINSHELGRYLNDNGFIKNPIFGASGFSCQISHYGIQQIHPEYFNDLISQAIMASGQLNDWTGLIETSSFQPRDYQRAHDLGKVLEQLDLAEVQYHHDDVYIKLTLQGRERYQRENEGGFMSMH